MIWTLRRCRDELVNNPNMSEQKKWGIEDKITKLSADRDVLNWRRLRTTPPTVEDFEAKKGYIEQQKQFNQDAIVNGLGNGTLKVGSDEWYALQKKGDKLQEQIDAYNRGMMGVLDGEKAVSRETSREAEAKPSFIDDVMDTVSNAGRWVVDTVTGGVKWVQDNKEEIGIFFDKATEYAVAKNKAEEAEKKSLMGSLEGDYSKLAPALDSMMKILDEQDNKDVGKYIEKVFKDMLAGGEFSTLVPVLQSGWDNAAFGNKVFVTDYDYDVDIRSEMEVLAHGTINTYNQGPTLNDTMMDLTGMLMPSPETDIYTDVAMYALEEVVDSIKLNNPGEILQDGDIRICIEPSGTHTTTYFFRNSDFLYSIDDFTGEVIYGENYDSILANMVQESINQIQQD